MRTNSAATITFIFDFAELGSAQNIELESFETEFQWRFAFDWISGHEEAGVLSTTGREAGVADGQIICIDVI